MPNKVKIKGWVEMDAKPVRTKTFAADITSAPSPKPQSQVAADAVKPLARPSGSKSKLRTVFVRPARGSDAQAKLVIVDEDDKPKYAQG